MQGTGVLLTPLRSPTSGLHPRRGPIAWQGFSHTFPRGETSPASTATVLPSFLDGQTLARANPTGAWEVVVAGVWLGDTSGILSCHHPFSLGASGQANEASPANLPLPGRGRGSSSSAAKRNLAAT